MAAHVELAAVLAVMVVGGTLGGRWVLWEFRHRRHQEDRTAARIEPVRVGEGDPRFGSMSALDDWAWQREQRTHESIMRDLAEGPPGDGTFAFTTFLPAAPDWREQTMAELSPAALGADLPQEPQAERLADTGDIEAAYGPADTWLDVQLAELFAWVRSQWEAMA